METNEKKIKENFKSEVTNFIINVNETNFYKLYDSLKSIILEYKGRLSKDEVLEELLNINNEMGLSMYQEEVIVEISSCISGNCSENKKIIL
ncbi:MAG TPA: hypothetical protein DF296_10795 [Candidatus Margulisbacteria bacterium]|nr:hypothetical protein [Candidatus Margulisiibacteriota bacterium]